MTKNFRSEIDKLRADIECCRDEINWLESAPIQKDELKSRVAENCLVLAERFDAQRRLGSIANPSAGFMELQAMFHASARVYVQDQMGVTSADSDEIGPMLAWAMGDTLIARMHAEIDRLDYRPGPPMTERGPCIAKAKATLRTLGQQEEALICRSEEAGDYIPRRLDADPTVILAYDPMGKTIDPKIARDSRVDAAIAREDSGHVLAEESSLLS